MKSVNIEDYNIPCGHIDETGQIVTKKRGITYYGCPHCGAVYVWDCFCGFATTDDNDNCHDRLI